MRSIKINFLFAFSLMFSSCMGQSDGTIGDWKSRGNNNQRTAYIDHNIMKEVPEVKVQGTALYYPLVKDGIVYYNDSNDRLVAFDIANETELWNLPIDFHFTKLVIGEDYNIFLAGTNNIVAIDLSLKEVIWKVQVEPMISSLSVEDNILYSTGNKLRAFDTKSGDVIWEFTPESIGTGTPYLGQPAFYEDTMYIGGNHIKFYALDKKNGNEIWNINQRIAGDPLFVSDKIIVPGFDFNLYALDPHNGAVVWEYQSENAAMGLAGTKDVVYMSAFNQSSLYLYAFDAGTGKIKWEREYESFGVSRLAAGKNGLVFCMTGETSNINLVNIENGKEIWQKDIESFITTSEIVLLNNAIIFIGEDLMEDTSTLFILR